MCLLIRNHRSWTLTVLILVLGYVHRSECGGGFFKPYFDDKKADFVKTDEKTYLAQYEFNLDHTLEQTGKFIKRFTDSVIKVESYPSDEEEEEAEEEEEEDPIPETTVEADYNAEESEDPVEQPEENPEENVQKSTVEEAPADEESAVEDPAVEEPKPSAKKEDVETPLKKKPLKKKFLKAKFKFKPGIVSILKNLKILLHVPIKVCKYEMKHPIKTNPACEKKEQKPSEDDCESVT